MFSSITSPAEASAGVVLLAFVWGCAGTPSAARCSVHPELPPTPPPAADCQPPIAPVQTPAATPPNAASDARMLTISTFDCIKAEQAQEATEPADAARVSKWNAGGPGGANWNVTDLLCFADIETSCERGQLTSALRVGQHRVTKQTTAIDHAGPYHIRLTAPERAWRSGLDADKPGLGHFFRTAVFSLLVEASCTQPIEVAAGQAAFGYSADSSAFVAGFASGE